MGYSQVVRQWFLVPSCAGSNPANPIVLPGCYLAFFVPRNEVYSDGNKTWT